LDTHIIGASRTTHARAVAKAVTWRGIGSFDTFVLGWLITGNAVIGGSIAVLELLTKMVLYYFHERAWSRVAWGVKDGAEPARESAAAAPAE
jgi:uncharacterized membrane protein